MSTQTSGGANTTVGQGSLNALTTGNFNTCIGQYAGHSIVTSSSNTCLGSQSDVNNSYSYSTVVGYGTVASASHQIMLGTSSETVVIPTSLTIGSSKLIKGYYSGKYSAPASNVQQTVSFGFTFSSVPIVVGTLVYASSSTNGSLVINSITTTSFSYYVFDNSNAEVESHFAVNWIAMN